jgi:hypothetical protein
MALTRHPWVAVIGRDKSGDKWSFGTTGITRDDGLGIMWG